jgi:hypothetical protein
VHSNLLRRASGPAAAAGLAGLLVLGASAAPAFADPGHGHPQSHSDQSTRGGAPAARSSTAGSSPSSAGDAPAGNNGTIKIEDTATGGGHANHAHVDCQFWVSFFGYDAGAQTARLIFEGQAPTRGPVLLDTTTNWTTADRTGGGQLDSTYGPVDLTQAFAKAGMTPHNKQGFHVKLTVHVTGSQGSDVKHKVFWVEPCSSTAPAPVAPQGSATAPAASQSTPACTCVPAVATNGASATPAVVAGATAPGGTPAAGAATAGATATPAEVLGHRLGAAGFPVGATNAASAAPATAVLGESVTAPAGGGVRPAMVAASGATSAPGALPFTGSNTKPLLMLALGLVALGSCAWLTARHRRA